MSTRNAKCVLVFMGKSDSTRPRPAVFYTASVLRAANASSVPLSHHQAMIGMSKQREQGTAWQQACRLVLARADAKAVTEQLSLALFMDAKLDVGRLTPRGA
jgi:hypothetical protein